MNAKTTLRRPLLSVAVYTYAQERLVRETLDSLLPDDGGTAAAETTEIIVSDDCSPDGTADVTVPIEHARQLFAAANEPKRLLLLPDHGHSFIGAGDRFIPTVVDWLWQQVFLPGL